MRDIQLAGVGDPCILNYNDYMSTVHVKVIGREKKGRGRTEVDDDAFELVLDRFIRVLGHPYQDTLELGKWEQTRA